MRIVLMGFFDCFSANVIKVLSVAASSHRHVGGNCIVTVPLWPLFPKAVPGGKRYIALYTFSPLKILTPLSL